MPRTYRHRAALRNWDALAQNRFRIPLRMSRRFSETGSAWSPPPLRTDSVNRGFCISLFTLEMPSFDVSIKSSLLHHPKMNLTQNLFSPALVITQKRP
jgi:hypothetical protein